MISALHRLKVQPLSIPQAAPLLAEITTKSQNNLAQTAQAGANSILTEQELGNPFNEGLERIWKTHENNRKHQILATIAANIQFNNDVTQTIENWFKTNYNQPHASFDSPQQATDAFFQAIRTIN